MRLPLINNCGVSKLFSCSTLIPPLLCIFQNLNFLIEIGGKHSLVLNYNSFVLQPNIKRYLFRQYHGHCIKKSDAKYDNPILYIRFLNSTVFNISKLLLPHTTASTITLSPTQSSFTPVSFFLLKLKLSRYPLSRW